MMLVTVSVVGLYVQKAVNERSHSVNWGTTAGRGFEVHSMPLDPGRGSYVRFEVSSTDGHSIDVYLTDMDGLRAARSGNTFEFDPQGSAMDVGSIVRELRISEYSYVVVMSHEPHEVVSIASSTDQSSYPLGLMPVLQAAELTCWIANIALFALLIHSWNRYSRERRAGGH